MVKIRTILILKISTDLCAMRENIGVEALLQICRYCLQCFSKQRILLIDHKNIYLNVNGKQSLKLRNRLNLIIIVSN